LLFWYDGLGSLSATASVPTRFKREVPMHHVVIDVTASQGPMETCEVTVAVRGPSDSHSLSVPARRRPSSHAGSFNSAVGRGLQLVRDEGGRR
jgi:hypothetical protein